MFDHQDGEAAVLPQAPDLVRQLERLLRVHPGRRLVEEQELGFGGQGPGDLQPSAVRVGEHQRQLVLSVAGQPGPEEREGFGRPLPNPLLLFPLPREAEHAGEQPGPAPAVLADHGVLQHGHVREQVDGLERPGDAEPGDLRGLQRHDALPLEPHVAVVGPVQAGDGVEQRRLARPVRTDHADDLAQLHLEVQPVQRGQSAEPLRDPADLEQRAHVGVSSQEIVDGRASGTPPPHASWRISSSWSSRVRRTLGIRPSGRYSMIAMSTAP